MEAGQGRNRGVPPGASLVGSDSGLDGPERAHAPRRGAGMKWSASGTPGPPPCHVANAPGGRGFGGGAPISKQCSFLYRKQRAQPRPPGEAEGLGIGRACPGWELAEIRDEANAEPERARPNGQPPKSEKWGSGSV